MTTTSYDSICSIGSTRITIPVGATLAVFMSPFTGQISQLLKLTAGGTCEVLAPGLTQIASGVFLGTTMAAATLAAISGQGYCLSTNEILSINGPACFYLSSTSATSMIHSIWGKGQGY